ncbi:hypothetical protein LJC18_04695, partial [Lachnospiraceae bacterium OttesenSCG-928-E19]|nr:hypothetical protein [Lachnospiraceae bacterium OttesenSCG-928-E19]
MKIKKILVCIVLCVLCITGCKNETKEYVLTNTSIDADELVEMYEDSGECEGIKKNEKGDVVVLLTEEQREAWLKPQWIESNDSLVETIGADIFYNSEYTEIEVKGSKEELLAFDEMIKYYAYHAEVQQ